MAADLAYVCTMYHLPHSELLPSLTEPGLDLEGLMSEREVVEAYCSFRGLPVPSARVWSFYLALVSQREAQRPCFMHRSERPQWDTETPVVGA